VRQPARARLQVLQDPPQEELHALLHELLLGARASAQAPRRRPRLQVERGGGRLRRSALAKLSQGRISTCISGSNGSPGQARAGIVSPLLYRRASGSASHPPVLLDRPETRPPGSASYKQQFWFSAGSVLLFAVMECVGKICCLRGNIPTAKMLQSARRTPCASILRHQLAGCSVVFDALRGCAWHCVVILCLR